jgi:type IV secretory pathway VirB3-like protein
VVEPVNGAGIVIMFTRSGATKCNTEPLGMLLLLIVTVIISAQAVILLLPAFPGLIHIVRLGGCALDSGITAVSINNKQHRESNTDEAFWGW